MSEQDNICGVVGTVDGSSIMPLIAFLFVSHKASTIFLLSID